METTKKTKFYQKTSIKSDLETLGKILAAPNKQKIMYYLSTPKTPKELVKKTNLNFPTISKNLKDLEKLKLIDINNKNLRKGKIIVISKKGETAIEDIKKNNL
jgi:DNA-binding MarR family transcriptional regulator